MLYSPPDAASREQFHMGQSCDAYKWLGAHKTTLDGTEWQFTVWAPNALKVCVTGEFCNWRYEDYPMEKQFDGTWEIRLPASLFAPESHDRHDPHAAERLTAYKYAVLCADGQWHLRADPYAFGTEMRPGNASRLTDIGGYPWGDGDWMKKRETLDTLHSPVNIYEMHLGSWRRHEDGSFMTYEEIAKELIPYLKEMHYTHVEFLPVMEHPLDMSWGYQVTGFFAATSRYGTPKGLMHLIDELHKADIAVILDWVPAHFPRDEVGLYRFDGTPCYESADPRRSDMAQWGTILFDYARGEAKSFLLSSACFWLEWFHADGIRCDAVSAILYHDFCREPGQWVPNIYGGNENLEGAQFLRELNTEVYARFPGVMMIAEESTAYKGVTHPVYNGGLGFGFKWNMGWMNDTLFYIDYEPLYRKHIHNKLTFSLMYAFNENFILPFSHDEVVHGKHSMLDKNPGDLWQKFAGHRTLMAYQMAHPGKMLNFMGNEMAHFIEWKFDDQLDWFLLAYERHPENKKCIADLNRLYKETPAFWQQDDSWEGFYWLNADDSERSILSFVRRDKEGNEMVCVTNFTPAYYEKYTLPLPAYGYLYEELNTDSEKYGGSGKKNPRAIRIRKQPCGKMAYSADIVMPPLSTVIFRYKRPNRKK
ncbi:MAG: 1,4-alpha-glucan branching protein GlgB [Clostridia bacterium]|nr:1,4-alpha-glucan branching protein GlgB [Clostridia bacterium]